MDNMPKHDQEAEAMIVIVAMITIGVIGSVLYGAWYLLG